MISTLRRVAAVAAHVRPAVNCVVPRRCQSVVLRRLPAAPLQPATAPRPVSTRYALRLASTQSGAKATPSAWANIWSSMTVANARAYAPQIFGVGAGIIVLYGVSDIIYWITTTILSLDMYDVFYMGFSTGSLSVLLLAGTAFGLYRRARIQPERALRLALGKVQRSPAVTAVLGTNVREGALRAYSRVHGHVAVSRNRRLAWVEPRSQFLFQVAGDKGDAFVSGEAVKHNGRVILSLLAVDTPSHTVLLVGDEDKLSVRGSLRGFLQVQRAQYIQQTRQEDDDARVREQEEVLPDDGSDVAKPKKRTSSS